MMSGFLEMTVDKFTFRIATDRLYNREGLWVKKEDALVRIGLSDFMQQRSGDVAFVEIKPVGTTLVFDDEIASIETIKVNISLGSPLAGRILETNPVMETAPETLNLDPYDQGWLALLEPADWNTDQSRLLNARAYFDIIRSEAEQELDR
jgi:glycine cleavage system H protein